MKNLIIGGCVLAALVVGFFAWRTSEEKAQVPIDANKHIEVDAPTPVANEPSEEANGPNGTASTADDKPATLANVPPPATQEEADDFLRESFEGEDPITNELLGHDLIISKLVAAADAIWRDQNPKPPLNFLNPTGKFEASRQEGIYVIGQSNYNRYEPFLKAFEMVDDTRIIDTYRHLKPLFKRAYADLGNTHVTWDELVLQSMDKLIEMEVPDEAPALTSAGKYYIFTDPRLEKLSPANKMLIRMGPKNSARFQGKLKRLRQSLAP